jgi:hypothetical protein
MARKVTYEQTLVAHGWVHWTPRTLVSLRNCSRKTSAREKKNSCSQCWENAVEYFQKYVLARKPNGKKLFQEAEEWFLEKDSDGLFSFENSCETLELHPDYIRQGLLVWKEAKLKLSSVGGHRAGRPKLSRTRVTQTSGRLSKTA